ncbi:hypothetical protein QBC39DRAFT_146365 [Podospora conica]|nr:hypothetical protein QBC39DRAFT_146365 [Schizothecium conicum]
MAMAARFCLLVLALLPWCISAHQGGYDYGFDVSRQLNKRQSGEPIVVKGWGSDNVQVRQEIRELERDRELWTLYLLGVSLMQFSDQSSPISWYSLTGIHGIPYKTWQGVGPTLGNEKSGYCTHASILFPTWHRPYLVLYEQVLYDLIQQIASWWPEGEDGDRYRAAAPRFRIPFWDWASAPPSNDRALPASVGGSPDIVVDGPNGSQRIANPLFSYTFKPLNSTELPSSPFNVWGTTVRAPSTNDNRAQSNNALVAQSFDASVQSLSERLYVLFSNYPDYKAFSHNNKPTGNRTAAESLESLHDSVHTLAGGGGLGAPNIQGGHMAFIPYSAFDPIFFLHHTMVDRIFAIWQTLYPQSWVTPVRAQMSSYTTSRGQIQDSTTALTPFLASSNGTFWTSDMVRNHTRFGYTYPELVTGLSNTNIRSQATRSINRLYGQSSPANRFQAERRARGLSGSGPHDTSSEAQRLRGLVFNGNQYREWIANVYVGKQALGEPFAVHLFLGTVPRDPRTWSLSRNHIGSVGVFSSDEAMDMAQLQTSGTVPLTTRLIDKVESGELSSLEPKYVESYLKRYLKKAVIGASGRVYRPAGIPSLGVEVVSTLVRAPDTEDELPKWGSPEKHFVLTERGG